MADSSSSKKWLKEASMRRLSLYIKNKTEQVGNAMIFDTTMSLPEEDIEKSGLSSNEIYHLQRWVAGVETGRQCMLAILDYRLTQNNDEHKNVVQKDNFQPMELIKSMINLPNDFLCDSGYIYTTIFQRPPTSVIKEALLLVVQKAFEKFPSSLGIEQINLAIKQLRIDSLVVGIDSMCSKSMDDNVDENIKIVGTVEEEFFRLQIFIELIRMHIMYCNKKNELSKASFLDPMGCNKDENIFPKSTMDDIDLVSGNLFSNPSVKLDILAIEQHLRTPIEKAVEQAEQMSPDDLEGVNSLLKPYLKRLSELKTILSEHLKDLHESKSFLALGLSADASDEAIKKAYRTLAIKLHPDKPGGDTQKFQQLQDAYQEVMKKKKHDKAENEAMNEMKPTNKTNSNTSKNQNQHEQKKSKPNTTDKPDEENVSNNHKKQHVDNKETGDIQMEELDGENEIIISANDKDSTDEVDSITEEEMKEIDQEILVDENNKNVEINGDVHQKSNKNFSEDDTFSLEDFMEKIEKNQDSVNNILDSDDEDEEMFMEEKSKKTYENGMEHAQDIVNQIGELLQRIKKSAGEITRLAQLNIKWQKMIEKAMEQPYSLKEVYKIITASTGTRSVLKRVKDKLPISNMEACALHQAIFPLENMCEWAQQISALAMEMPNSCGKEYASAASANKAFIYSIERSMHLSLGALKTVISLINAQEQLASCIRRIKDSMKLAAENPEIQSLLLEMVRTGIKSNIVTMSNTVDRVIETTIAASDVRDAAQQLMRVVDIFTKSEVKRKAADSESREMEEDYCEEDREALRKCREDRREEDRKNMQRTGSTKDGDKNKENGCDENKNSESNNLNELKDKIRILQMQLKIQHIQALQTLNSEVVILQAQIFKELKALPFIASIDSIFSDKPHKQNSSISSKKDKENVIDFKISLITLLADIVDSTCNALKLEFTRLPYTTPSDITIKDHDVYKARRVLIEKHLSWMFIILADGSCAKATLQRFFVTLMNSISNNDIETLNENKDPSINPSMKLALLPDYRAKCLYLASMVDISAVHTILGIELQQRIEELFFEGKISTSTAMVYSSTTVVTQINDSTVELDLVNLPSIDHIVEDLDIDQIDINIDRAFEAKQCSISIFDIDEEIYQHPNLTEVTNKLESLLLPDKSSSEYYQENISFVENKLKPHSNIEKIIVNENIKPNICNYPM